MTLVDPSLPAIPPWRDEVIVDALSPRRLHLILFPTEQCNFRCVYCYEDFVLGRMSESTISGILSLLSHRAADLDGLQISWFGGEPLAAYDIVTRISELIGSRERHCILQ